MVIRIHPVMCFIIVLIVLLLFLHFIIILIASISPLFASYHKSVTVSLWTLALPRHRVLDRHKPVDVHMSSQKNWYTGSLCQTYVAVH